MKRFLLFFLAVFACATARSEVKLVLTIGELRTADGSSLLPNNALLQLVISTNDSLLTAPTSGSFVGGSSDDLVLASWGLDANLGPGTSQRTVTFSLNGAVTQGDKFELRWYPTLTTAASAPTAGVNYGSFRSDSTLDGSNIDWSVPADGTYQLNFITQSVGGSVANSAGYANKTVAEAIPEPTSLTLLLAGLVGTGVFARRKR